MSTLEQMMLYISTVYTKFMFTLHYKNIIYILQFTLMLKITSHSFFSNICPGSWCTPILRLPRRPMRHQGQHVVVTVDVATCCKEIVNESNYFKPVYTEIEISSDFPCILSKNGGIFSFFHILAFYRLILIFCS